MENIHQLALVLMETLYLHIEDRSWIYVNAVVLLDVLCKTDLILVLDLHKLLLAFLVLCTGKKLCNMGQICDPLVSNLGGYPVCQKRVAVKQEAPLSNAVCLIVELLRHHFIEIL